MGIAVLFKIMIGYLIFAPIMSSVLPEVDSKAVNPPAASQLATELESK